MGEHLVLVHHQEPVVEGPGRRQYRSHSLIDMFLYISSIYSSRRTISREKETNSLLKDKDDNHHDGKQLQLQLTQCPQNQESGVVRCQKEQPDYVQHGEELLLTLNERPDYKCQ